MPIEFVAILPDWMTNYYIMTKLISWFLLFVEMPAFLVLGFGFDWSPFAGNHMTALQFMCLFVGQAFAFMFSVMALVIWVVIRSDRAARRKNMAMIAAQQAASAAAGQAKLGTVMVNF